MMNMEQLEDERKKVLSKLIILVILLIASIGYFLYKTCVLLTSDMTIEIVVSIGLFILTFTSAIFLPKQFEAKFKKNMIKDILKNIVGNNGEIKWENNSYYASISRTQVEKWNDEFKKEITCPDIDSLNERIRELEEDEDCISEEEKEELEQLKDQRNKIYEEHDEVCNKKFVEKLAELQNKVDKQEKPKEKDLLHIEFYKTQIKEYEEIKEIKKLQEKRDSVFTQEEQSKIDEYYNLFYEESLSDDEKDALKTEEQEKFQEYQNLIEKGKNALTKEENEKLDKYIKKFIDKSQNLIDNMSSYNHLAISYGLFDRDCDYDEMFYGKYKDTDFIVVECEMTEGSGKSKSTFLKGNVIQIPYNLKYKNKMVIMEKKIFIINLWEDRITHGLKELKLDVPLNNKKKIFTDKMHGTEEILNHNFIDFVNSLDSKYSYAFVDGKLYIIWNTRRDYFKLGSLFKKVDDEKQYEKFKNDMIEVLDIVEKVGKLDLVK